MRATAAVTTMPDEAVTAADRLIALNPTSVDHRLGLVRALVLAGDWRRVEIEAGRALAVYPLDAQTRLFRAVALAKLGRAAEASREAAAALALHTDPKARADGERWFAGQLR